MSVATRALLLAAGVTFTPACTGSIETPPGPTTSCSGGLGADQTCGAQQDTDCCATSALPGGTYNRMNNAMYPATVSAFSLDIFEVTVGRFRSFVEAYPGAKPKAGDGANPHIAGSGWNTGWDAGLPATQAELLARLSCADSQAPQYAVWTAMAGTNERTAVSCVDWYTAFAFCAWDGGRLPTDAEWNFAAVGGDEQRTYPWGTAAPDLMHAAIDFDGTPNANIPVGSATAGEAKWGQLDIGGSRNEWTLDFAGDGSMPADSLPVVPCVDCAPLTADVTNVRVFRDTGFLAKPMQESAAVTYRSTTGVNDTEPDLGIRCARDAPTP